MDFEKKEMFRQKFRDSMNYIIIAVVSIISTVFLPLLNSKADLSLVWPTTKSEWFLWIAIRLSIALINMIMFYCFMEQAKVNVKDHPKYKEACEMLSNIKLKKQLLPQSPKIWNAKQYSTKLTMIFIFSFLSLVAFGNAILNFDLVMFLSAIFTIVIGLVFGLLQMRKAEYYWTNEFWLYAKMESEKVKDLEVFEEKTIIIQNDLENAKMG